MFGEKVEDYEILEHLGKGGFAHVYRAKCRNSGLFVAIKMIDKVLMASSGMISRVRQEVTIHSRLKHPAILELYTFFEDSHYVYLVLELAHNGELAKHFKLGTRGLDEKAAADIFRQVLSGVIYLHTHNIIHRDLSLNNLLLTKDLKVKIADFGLATQLNGPDEKHVTMCGTPNYISPEVASREVHGLPADVWGLGCMLYTLLVGSPPFHTQHIKTTLNKVINADYKIPSELSREAQDLLQKLLCKDPIKRISLKGIMEHPFLNMLSKQDESRDSGFLTTVHSTQHSSKLKYDSKLKFEYLGMPQSSSSTMEEKRPVSFNIFNGMQDPILLTHFSEGASNQPPSNIARNLYGEVLQHKKQHTILPHVIENNNDKDNEFMHFKNLHIKCKSTQYMSSKSNSDENKENIPKACINTNSLNVPPLCADRLPTISHRTRNAILKIEPLGVTVEFIKKKGKNREEKIVEVCKISKDGMKIVIFKPDTEKTKDYPHVEHDPNPDEVFSYHNLPQKHWKKYLYAARFVDLVKAKTPKITLYSKLAKCQLMENGTDLEAFFYTGEKVTNTASEGLKIIDKNLKTYCNAVGVQELKSIFEHFEECSGRMKRVQETLSCLSDECYPLIIGRRPTYSMENISSPHQGRINSNLMTPVINIDSFHRGASSSNHAYSDYNR